jgi:hypothetical protein
VQLTCIAAHGGTATGLGGPGGDGDGVGVGLGDGVGVGLDAGLELADAMADGLTCATAGPFAVQPATASNAPASTSPLLTGIETPVGGPALRGSPFLARRPE